MTRRPRIAAAPVGLLLVGSLLALVPATGSAAPLVGSSVVTASVSDTRVKLRTKVTVSGTVTPPDTEPRPVELEFQTATGWVRVRRTLSGPSGDYSMRVPTDWYGKHVMRAVAPATANAPAGVSPTQSTTVIPRYDPRGKKTSWKRFTPLARWDPCRTVEYRTNFRVAPDSAPKLVRRAFKLAHEATGLTFKRVGSTTKVPYASGPDSGTHLDYGLIVAWSTPKRVPGLAGSTAGLGGSTAVSSNGGPWRYVYGGAVIDARQKLPVSGFSKGQSTGALLLHEIAHALGLTHVSVRSQIMYPSLQSTFRGRYENGDLGGLHELGAAQGCLS